MRMQIASISSYAFNDHNLSNDRVNNWYLKRFDQDESVFDSRFFRISESNWMNTFFQWIYSSVELRKETTNFKSTDCAFLFTVAKPWYQCARFTASSCSRALQHVRCRRRRNVTGPRRCTFDLPSLVDFFDRRIYSSSLIPKTFLSP